LTYSCELVDEDSLNALTYMEPLILCFIGILTNFPVAQGHVSSTVSNGLQFAGLVPGIKVVF